MQQGLGFKLKAKAFEFDGKANTPRTATPRPRPKLKIFELQMTAVVAQRRIYRQLPHRKCRDFWAEKIETERTNPAKLWRSVDNLLGRGRVSASLCIGVEDFNKFFTDKVVKVRSTTSNAPPPVFTPCQADASFREFTRISTDDVIAAVRQLPDKSSAADLICSKEDRRSDRAVRRRALQPLADQRTFSCQI